MALGQFLFSQTSKSTNNFSEILYSQFFWFAVLIYGVASIIWVVVLRKIPLHIAYPLAAALTTITISVYALFTKEFKKIFKGRRKKGSKLVNSKRKFFWKNCSTICE